MSCGGRQNAPVPWAATYHSPAPPAGGREAAAPRSNAASEPPTQTGIFAPYRAQKNRAYQPRCRTGWALKARALQAPTARTGLGVPRLLPRSLLGCALPEGGARPSPPNPLPSAVSGRSPALHAACGAAAPAARKTSLSFLTPLSAALKAYSSGGQGSSELGDVCLVPDLPLPRPSLLWAPWR